MAAAPANSSGRFRHRAELRRVGDTLADIEHRAEQRCRDLEADPDTIRATTLSHWWPQNTKPNGSAGNSITPSGALKAV